MKATIKTAVVATAATFLALGILAFSTESERKRQIAMAKRNIAERKAQMEARKAELEAELKNLKAELKEIEKASDAIADLAFAEIEAQLEVAAEPVTESAPVVEEVIEPAPKVKKSRKSKKSEPETPTWVARAKGEPQPDGEFSLENQYLGMTIRELKAIASQKKLKGYGSMKKAELTAKLAELG